MSALDRIRDEVTHLSEELELPECEAFGYWYLEEIVDLSPEEAEEIIAEGPWGGGRDAVYFDDDYICLKIFRFTYSEDPNDAVQGLIDLQNGIGTEIDRIRVSNEVRLYLVTIARENDDIDRQKKVTRRAIKTWLRSNNLDISSSVDVVDILDFSQESDEIHGVDIELNFIKPPIIIGNNLLGIIDASAFKNYTEKEELLTFNIRKFLGKRKGSISYQIDRTLGIAEDRSDFWILNNGIVCLCTQADSLSESKISFKNFTVVNGAQTINTISQFLERDSTIVGPIWVSAKILKVSPDQVDYAAKLTTTSNSQNPTSSKDLRAIDASHRRLSDWLLQYYGLPYTYRRGGRMRRGISSISMKDIAQSYVAYHLKQPNVAFGYVGRIFAKNEYYSEIFPQEEIQALNVTGTDNDKKNFLLDRIMPVRLTELTRTYLKSITQNGGIDKKFRSLSYHITWTYSNLLSESYGSNKGSIFNKIEELHRETIENIVTELIEICDMPIMGIAVPKDLKTENFVRKLEDNKYMTKRRMLSAKFKIEEILRE